MTQTFVDGAPRTSPATRPPLTGPPLRPLTSGDRAFLHFSRLNPGERLEAGVVLCVDDPTLTVHELRAHVATRLAEAPALTERLSPPTGRSAAGVGWQLDHEPSLGYHVNVEELPAGSGQDGLREAMDRIASRPLDLNRPLWRIWLLRGHRPDGVEVVYRFSHIHQDGAALHQALHLLFGLDREPALRNLPTFGAPTRRDYARMASGLLRGIPRTRQLTSWGGPPHGGARHTWAIAELDRLRRIARRNAATVNDVYLAAVAGALRTWSRTEWTRYGRPVHAVMPISLRTPAEQEILSNFTFGVRIPLPCAEPDPRRRLARVAAQTRRIKAGGRMGTIERRILDRVPPNASPRMLAGVAASGSRAHEVALVASNTGTMRGPYAIAGRQVRTLIGMPPLFVGRQHLSVALFGLDAHVCAAFTASASVPRHAELADRWLAELAALD
ncbi:diacylglycerol O-acyltransferase [Parafrankia irregularis]|uniref:diacylglycerol O-acyltransferase n=1 Tax=Parafrankia irregularis TaxID=795642 RepID=A0A0S4QDF2_9ACTN|nr:MULTISPECIES: wax ester/triacylglycerol synthase domain-containing protein [Parafrankia]MBE3199667.1 DUF1298 domain-containing protein [Parafrankia sp. CH37]CUU53664.1 diacylglycerol O-acyltransferase [Parafrankia irregularis]